MAIHILLLYIARTSSSYIWQIFKLFQNIKVYGEIMNGPEKYLKKLNANEKLEFLNEQSENQDYRNFAKKHFDQYIEFLDHSTDQKYFFTKVSLVHIYNLLQQESPILEKVFAKPDTKIIVLERDLIDTYVSLQKVKLTGKWREFDTTNITVRVDEEDFQDYSNRMTSLYNKLYTILGKIRKKHLLIKYNHLHNNPEVGQDNLCKISWLQLQLQKHLNLNLELDPERYINTKLMFKQDRNTNSSDKFIKK